MRTQILLLMSGRDFHEASDPIPDARMTTSHYKSISFSRTNAHRKKILDLECYCPKKSLGCQWCGKLAQLQPHDAECSFSEVKCLYVHLGCTVVVLRHQLASTSKTIVCTKL
ncbi:hypothetical protein OS493_022922 [Desmophyllum pertusum]|uniref:Uncharacterized protein n=1 Tax=Desmophyllum pertusum TaxID=174260 RepID=A0A9W9ZMF6_9CNID|nr:hypothetical protein OS493_022922 [Desmophyllum pertusum]